MNVENPALIRTLLLGLTSECPRGEDCRSCPLLEKRKFSYSQKKDWIRSLDDGALKAIYSEHCRCLEGLPQRSIVAS